MKVSSRMLPLLVGIGLPLFMILLVALSIYIPKLLVKNRPQYNFIFTAASVVYPQSGFYSVQDGKLILQCSAPPPAPYPKPAPLPGGLAPACNENQGPPLYFYNAKTQSNHVISLAVAQRLPLISSSVSPDGYKVSRGSSGDVFPILFGGHSNYDHWYLVGHHVATEIDISNLAQPVYDLQVLGWTREE